MQYSEICQLASSYHQRHQPRCYGHAWIVVGARSNERLLSIELVMSSYVDTCRLSLTYWFHVTGNYYTDSCLIAGGGRSSGVLDFYQMHTYSYNGQWGQDAPFKV